MNGLVCPVDRHMPLAAAWARAADIDRQLQVQAAAAGIIVLRAEVRGSHPLNTHLCLNHARAAYGTSTLFHGNRTGRAMMPVCRHTYISLRHTH